MNGEIKAVAMPAIEKNLAIAQDWYMRRWNSPPGRKELNAYAEASMQATRNSIRGKKAKKRFDESRKMAKHLFKGICYTMSKIKALEAQDTLRYWREAETHMIMAILISVQDHGRKVGGLGNFVGNFSLNSHLVPSLNGLIAVITVTDDNVHGACGIARELASKDLLTAWDEDEAPSGGDLQYQGVQAVSLNDGKESGARH